MSMVMEEEIKRWTAKRKSARVIEIRQGKMTVAGASRAIDLPPSEIDGWVDDAERGKENTLRTNPQNMREQYEKQLKQVPLEHDIRSKSYFLQAERTMKILTMLAYCSLAAALLGLGVAQAEGTKNVETPRLVTQAGHSQGIETLAFSPDGKTVASGSSDSNIILWDVASGRELRTLSGHTKKVTSVAFSPDGTMVASASRDDTVRLWAVASGQLLNTLDRNLGLAKFVAFSPDGKMIVAGGEAKTKLWLVVGGKELFTLSGLSATSIAFSPDGNTLVLGSFDHTLKLLDVASGELRRTLSGHSSSVTSVAFASDGKTVVSGSWDKTLKLWNAESGMEICTLSGHLGWVDSVGFSPDAKKVASGGLDGALKLWDVERCKELNTFKHGNGVSSLAFSPDGQTVASASFNIIRLREAASGKRVRDIQGHTDWIRSAQFSSDGKMIVAGSNSGTVTAWNLFNGQEPRALTGHAKWVGSIALSQDGRTLVSGSGDKTLKLWDVASGTVLRTLSGHSNDVASVAFSPDAKMVVSGSTDKTVRFWEVASGKELRTTFQHNDQVRSVAFSPDGKTVVSGSVDTTLRLLDAANYTLLHTLSGHTFHVESVAFSPDSKRVVSGSNDGTLVIWNVVSGQILRQWYGHIGSITSVAFSPDGESVISGNERGTLTQWGVLSGKEVRTFKGHTGYVESVAFSTDGKMLVSGGGDGTLKLWRIADGAQLATLTAFSDGRWVVTDPEGRFDTADLEDMPHLHWVMPDDPMTPLPIETFMRDYYEPHLLSRILNGEKFKPVRALGELNRVQPEVKITGIAPDSSDAGFVNVTVEALGTSRRYAFSDKTVATAAHDLRLFRDGQLVGYAEGKLAEAGSPPFIHAFRVALPSGASPLNFSAYALNNDRIKSSTAHLTYTRSSAIVVAKPRAYVITIGVNHHDNPAWDLRYAANDARQIGKSVAPLLQKQGKYKAVVTIPLISDAEGRNLATKANLKAVLGVLAGRKADVSAIPGGDKLRQATPDDLVLISFSGHGYGEGGLFYLIASDTGTGQGRLITPDLAAHAISSDELSTWLRDVDSGDMALIVDACHSAASVGDEFKPGPMGSRGLGQLAFDKGMRILAASQADDVALESDLIKQGLLSFALIQNGLEGEQADYQPKDRKITLAEWLNYGVSRVPTLAEEVRTGKVVSSRGAVRASAGELLQKRVIQQPSLFDFTKGRRNVLLKAEVR